MKTPFPFGSRGGIALLFATIALTSAARAAAFTWKGGAASNAWTLNGNWTTSAPANNGTAAVTFTDAFFTGTNFGAALDGGLVKSGAGTMTLRGANTYTGRTVVNAGTLQIGVNGSLLNSWVEVAPGGTFTMSNVSVNAGTGVYFSVGTASSATAATANLVAGSLSTGETDVGNAVGSIATFAHSGGMHSVDAGLYVGVGAGSTGSYTLSGTGALSTLLTRVGHNGTGTFTQTGGTHTVGSGALVVGRNAGAGSYVLQGGTLDAVGTTVGFSGAGTFTQSGGTHTTSGDLYLGVGSTSDGTYTLSGAASQLTTAHTNVGYIGTGAFTQNGGTHTTVRVYLGRATGSTGTYRLNGGTLQTSEIESHGEGAIYFNGGLVQLTGKSSPFLGANTDAYLGAGGAKIDTNGRASRLSAPIARSTALPGTGTAAALARTFSNIPKSNSPGDPNSGSANSLAAGATRPGRDAALLPLGDTRIPARVDSQRDID